VSGFATLVDGRVVGRPLLEFNLDLVTWKLVPRGLDSDISVTEKTAKQLKMGPENKQASRSADAGLTLLELMIAMAVVVILASIATATYANALEKARITRAIADIRVIEKALFALSMDGSLPESLDEIGWGDSLDPWGSPYQYLNFESANGKGKLRKDRFLVPLNSDYDLYSKGRDGQSKPPLSAKASHDDIIRAGDGAFVGLASEF